MGKTRMVKINFVACILFGTIISVHSTNRIRTQKVPPHVATKAPYRFRDPIPKNYIGKHLVTSQQAITGRQKLRHIKESNLCSAKLQESLKRGGKSVLFLLLMTYPGIAGAANQWNGGQNDQIALFEPSAWIAAALFVIGGSLMLESVKSGGLQQDLDRIKSFFSEKIGMMKVDDDQKLEQRRKQWMEKIKEADKPKSVGQQELKKEEEMTYDLEELFEGIEELRKKSKEKDKV